MGVEGSVVSPHPFSSPVLPHNCPCPSLPPSHHIPVHCPLPWYRLALVVFHCNVVPSTSTVLVDEIVDDSTGNHSLDQEVEVAELWAMFKDLGACLGDANHMLDDVAWR